MKRLASILTFVFLLILIVEFRLRFVDSSRASSFVFMLLLTVISSLYWGFFIGIGILALTALVIAYFFLTPQNLYLLTSTDINQIVLFFMEGVVIIFLIHILKKGKEQEHDLRERFQVILSSIGDAVIATNKTGHIQYMNAAAQRITGWRFRDAHKKNLADILRMEDKEDRAQYYTFIDEVIKDGKTYSVDKPITFLNRKGTAIDIQDTIAPLRNIEGKSIGLVLIFRDVSERRDMAEEREVLLGSISHELKNYITSIQGYTHIVRKKSQDTNDEKLISYTEKLYDKVDTMKNMIISMLDLSKLKMGKLDMNIEEFDIENLTKAIINDLQINTNHKIIMKGVVLSPVLGDKIRIGQVLTNLLSNAIKYSPEEKEIQVLLKENDGDVEVAVRDYGNGISQERMQKLFKPFYRAVSESDKTLISGSGLGLYISKDIVKQHGGKMWVKSDVGKGSTFYFTIPTAMNIEETSLHTPDSSMIGKIKKLLKLEYLK